MTDAAAAQHEPRGIGGWLIFPALGTIASPILYTYWVLQDVNALATLWHQHTPIWTYVVIAEIIAQLAIIAGWIVAVIFLIKRKRRYPPLFTSLLAAAFIIGLADTLVVANILGQTVDRSSIRDVVRSLVALVIWGAYMHESKRVKNTFVN
jgi:uncharacterized protein DUF2569